MNIILVLALAGAPTPFIPPKPMPLTTGVYTLMWAKTPYQMTLNFKEGTYRAWRPNDLWIGTSVWDEKARTLTVEEQRSNGTTRYKWVLKFKSDLTVESVTGVNIKIQVLPPMDLKIH